MMREEAEVAASLVEAQHWFARLRGPCDDATMDAFRDWYETSPDNARAFDRMERMFDQSAILKQSDQFGQLPRFDRRVRPHRAGRRILTASAALFAVVLMIVSPFFVMGWDDEAMSPQMQSAASTIGTARGEIRSLALTEQSEVTLDSATDIKREGEGAHKRIALERGRLRLKVGAQEHPITVIAGTVMIDAAPGAWIDMERIGQDRTRLTLVKGHAKFGPYRDRMGRIVAKFSSVILPQGREIIWNDGLAGVESPSGRAWTFARNDWPTGWVEASGAPLGLLIEEANRYARVPIMLDQKTVQDVTVSGRFKVSDTEAFIDSVSRLHDLSITRGNDAIHLRQK